MTDWNMRLVGAALLLGACGGGGGASPAGDPAGACDDLSAAVGAAAERCGESGPANEFAFLNAAACGACSNVTGVRDEGALRSECLPALSAESCTDLLAGVVPASCVAQLEHPVCP